MTKLEEEIADAVIKCDFAIEQNGEFVYQPESIAKAAAEVAKKYIEKAYWRAFMECSSDPKEVEEGRQAWLKENGII